MSHRKHAHWSLIVLTIVGAALITACGAANEVKVGESDAGRQIELAVGERLVVALESNPTTGFGWQVANIDEASLQQVGEAEYAQTGGEGLVGAGGTETFRFEAMEVGESELELVYRRAWEQDVAPERVFRIQVRVQ